MSERVYGIWRQAWNPATRRWERRTLIDTAGQFRAIQCSRLLMRRWDAQEGVAARYTVRKLRRPLRVRVLR